MRITLLIGSTFGQKTKIAADHLLSDLKEKHPEHEIDLLDLADYKMEFSDGRNFLDYSGDTGTVVRQLMEADTIFLITPIFQASIPGSLKNVFDLLPVQAFRDKVVGIVAVAGSEKHYLTIEQQLKPILAFMKAQIVQTYVFMLDTDFVADKIANDDIIFRLNRLVEETIDTARIYQELQAENDAKYDF
jgi:FMN reductase